MTPAARRPDVRAERRYQRAAHTRGLSPLAAQPFLVCMADKLLGVHPDLVATIGRVLAAMTTLGFPMRVTDGVRSLDQQQALYAQGRTAPGKIVTYADGIKSTSNHQAKADGYGHAVDCAFVGHDGAPSWAESWPWHTFGACVVAVGLSWGGNWRGKKRDRPHVELSA